MSTKLKFWLWTLTKVILFLIGALILWWILLVYLQLHTVGDLGGVIVLAILLGIGLYALMFYVLFLIAIFIIKYFITKLRKIKKK